jgi:hypothetical protein
VRQRRVMRSFPPGWATDLASREHCGSTVEDRGDHLIIRTPQDPDSTGVITCSSRTRTLWAGPGRHGSVP